MKRTIILSFFIAGVVFSSCNKWLDVKPQTQIESDEAFKDEQGFKDALTGVYVELTASALYGKELTYGMLDVLARQYTKTSGAYSTMDSYNYLQDSLRKRTNAVWLGMYKDIANVNNLIENLKTADKSLFSGVDYEIIKGEALGLRAFMHFDLLRLYAPAPASAGGMDAGGIPYVDKFSVQTVKHSKVNEVLTRIQEDLTAAAALLKTADPIVPGSSTPVTTSGYLRDRFYKFNYYAVKALQARVYLYSGDTANALLCAEEVINSNAFPWAISSDVTSGRDKVFVPELIFALNINDLHTNAGVYFNAESTSLLAKKNTEYLADFDNNGSDYRFIYQSSTTAGDEFRFPTRLTASTYTYYNFKMPLIRISEMYYIAAECLKNSDRSRSVEYLNDVKHARNNFNDVSASVSETELQRQIFREYRREFMCEGQLFFYYKRTNSPAIEYSTVTADNAVYVWPLPDDETEYGNP